MRIEEVASTTKDVSQGCFHRHLVEDDLADVEANGPRHYDSMSATIAAPRPFARSFAAPYH